MIPDFKTFIKESVWSDIQDRSTGETTRKEDDVNLLDGEEFGDYLNSLYKIILPGWEIDYDDANDVIDIPVFTWDGPDKTKHLALFSYDVVNNVFYSESEAFTYLSPDFPYETYEFDEDCLAINSKDGEVNNRFVLDILDFIIHNLNGNCTPVIKKRNINESVWSDIQDRSTGEQIRKEDSIDNLDFGDFFQYIKDHYEVCIPDPQHFFEIGQWLTPDTYTGNISIPIEKNNLNETPNMSNRMLMIQKDLRDQFQSGSSFTDGEMLIKPNRYVFRLYPNELRKTFGDKYELDVTPGGEGKIIPKSGKITNQVCIDVLDKLLGMVENPILKKKK